MNAKYLWLVLITLVFFGCDDNTGSLGLGMLPGTDGITVGTKTFKISTESATFNNGRVFAKTDIGYVGRFTDTEHGFGYYEGSFLTELNCIDSLEFPKGYDEVTNRSTFNMISNDLDVAFEGAEIILGYYSFFGDSLSPMQVSVYQIDDKLKKNHYTDVNPEEYVTSNTLLGKKTFSAVNQEDSARHEKNHLHTVTIPITDDMVGKNIIKKNWSNPESFYDSDAFIRDVFKGLYITSEVGDGTVLYIQHVQLNVKYKRFAVDSIGDIIRKHDNSADSIEVRGLNFASTMEVIQANKMQIEDDIMKGKAEEKGHTYLKSPAGIYTKTTLPIIDFIEKLDLENDTINAVSLTLDAYHHDIENEFSMSPPSAVLLIRESEAEKFFEENKLYDGKSSYVARYSNNQYSFQNITRLITALIKEVKDAEEKAKKNNQSWDAKQWLKDNPSPIAIIPVVLKTAASSTTVTYIEHDLKPTYVKLKGGVDGPELDLKVIYSKFVPKN